MSGAILTLARRGTAWARRRLNAERRVVAAEFDRNYYLAVNPDVAVTGADPLDHFLAHGWREGRDPNGRFSVVEYLNDNPDVVAAGVNPFAHYLRSGRAEGRTPAHDMGFRYRILARQIRPQDQLDAAARATLGVKIGTPAQLSAGLASSRTGLRDLHITFSHDDYRTNVGGVQLCIQREAAGLVERGHDHLHLCPPVAWPMLRLAGEEGRLLVLLNGRPLGTFPPAVIAEALARVPASGGVRSFAVHSLLGHTADETIAIVRAAGLGAGFFWLHDYASLCAGYNLLRNNVEDCAAPPPNSAACGICIYGPWRGPQAAAHATLFAGLDLTVVSPAARTLDFWRASGAPPISRAVVHPHATLAPRGPAPRPSADRPLRVAYVGWPVAHKGWPLFQQLALRYAGDPRYAFHHLGARAEPGLPVSFREVRVTAEQPAAMQAALEAAEIDVLIFWPLWRETFSFTVYEAIAAGCAVITGPDSGNVAAMVEAQDAGWVLETPDALEAAFASGEVAKLARARRASMLYDMTLSGMTLDLIPAIP